MLWTKLVLISKLVLLTMLVTLFAYVIGDEMTTSLHIIIMFITYVVVIDMFIKHFKPLISSLNTIKHAKNNKKSDELRQKNDRKRKG